MEKLDSIKTA